MFLPTPTCVLCPRDVSAHDIAWVLPAYKGLFSLFVAIKLCSSDLGRRWL